MVILHCIVISILIVDFNEASIQPRSSVLYPYGGTNGDKLMETITSDDTERDAIKKHVKLTNFVLGLRNIYISEAGFVGFDYDASSRWDLVLPNPNNIFIAGYVPYDGCLASKGGPSKIYHREDTRSSILSLAHQDIKKQDPQSDFQATSALIITFENVTNRYITFRKNTFQIVVAHNNNKAFIIMNYDRLDDSGALAGFNLEGSCNFKSFAPVTDSYKLRHHSNINVLGRYVYQMNGACQGEVRYKYASTSYKNLAKGDTVEEYIKFSQSMPLWKGKRDGLYLSVDGRMSAASLGGHKEFDLKRMEHDVIVILNIDIDTTEKGKVSYAEQNDASTLSKASRDISHFLWKEFKAQQTFLVTYDEVYSKINNKNRPFKIQAVLTSDGEDTYLIVHQYEIISEQDIVSGVSCKQCSWNWFGKKEWTISVRTNTGYKGQFIYKVNTKWCMNEVFLPFGGGIDPNEMGMADEVSKKLNMKKKIPFLSDKTDSFYVSTNSAMSSSTLNEEFWGKTVFQKGGTGSTVFSLFYNDMFTEFGGNIFWRETESASDLANITKLVNKRFPNMKFAPSLAVVVTLVNVMQYGVRSSRNTLQQILATDGTQSFGILNLFQTDSVHGASSGYYDMQCSKSRTFRTYTEEQLDTYFYEINPVVVPLLSADCSSGNDINETAGWYNPPVITTIPPSVSTTTTKIKSNAQKNNQKSDDDEKGSSSNMTLIIGCAAGGGVLFILLVVGVVVFQKRKNSGN